MRPSRRHALRRNVSIANGAGAIRIRDLLRSAGTIPDYEGAVREIARLGGERAFSSEE